MVFRAKDVPFLGVSAFIVAVGAYLATLIGLPMEWALFAFGVQWLVFIHAGYYETEKYFDLTGATTYICLNAYAYVAGTRDVRQTMATLAVMVWAVRLGSFLYGRILTAGKDDRFDAIKPYTLRFFNFWTVQGLWVFLTSLPVLALNHAARNPPLNAWDLLGFSLWATGLAIEALADSQKSEFRRQAANREKFISSGLWAWSRHPNYFGEILLWTGLFIVSTNVLRGAEWLVGLSPVFVAFLLTCVSGIPLLEKKANAKWGSQPDYIRYKQRTPVLIPRLPSAAA